MDIDNWKKVMKEKGITQIELSKIANIPLQTIRKIFSGITDSPRYDTIQAIEKALGITAEAPKSELTEAESRLLKAFNVLIPPMQEYVLSMIEGLTSQKQNVKTNVS